MLSMDKTVIFMNAIADQVEAFCAEHETADHGGQMCVVNRMSAVCFLAHRLGIKPEKVSAFSFRAILSEYEKNCPHCKEKREGGPRASTMVHARTHAA